MKKIYLIINTFLIISFIFLTGCSEKQDNMKATATTIKTTTKANSYEEEKLTDFIKSYVSSLKRKDTKAILKAFDLDYNSYSENEITYIENYIFSAEHNKSGLELFCDCPGIVLEFKDVKFLQKIEDDFIEANVELVSGNFQLKINTKNNFYIEDKKFHKEIEVILNQIK